MNKDVIDEALSFYEIDEEKYKQECYRCLKHIKSSDKILKKYYQIYEILYLDKTNRITELWKIKSINELFIEKVHPYITNLLLLNGYKIHKQNIEKLKFDDEEIRIHKLRVREALINDIEIRNYNGIRVSQMVWGTYFINVKLIEIGRLQYEKCENNIKIHIPAIGKLDIDKVMESLKKSRLYIEKYFNIKNFNYYCDSWLLSKQIHSIVNKNSNIYKFYELFKTEDGESCMEDILNFVYQLLEIDDYKKLQENTTLQKSIKEYLLKGNDIKIGKGILKIKF